MYTQHVMHTTELETNELKGKKKKKEENKNSNRI